MRWKCNQTLIELLVVIAIIGILTSMLVPVLAQAKSQGYAITCKGQLKQFGQASAMYTLDYNRYLAPSDYGSTGGTGIKWFSSNILGDYIQKKATTGTGRVSVSNKILICPEAKDKAISTGTELLKIGFAVNIKVHNRLTSGAPAIPYSDYKCYTIESIKFPEKTIAFLDAMDYRWVNNSDTEDCAMSFDNGMCKGGVNLTWSPNLSPYYIYSNRHANLCNFAAVDGHVESFRILKAFRNEKKLTHNRNPDEDLDGDGKIDGW